MPRLHPVPWRQVFALNPYIWAATPAPMGRLYHEIASRLVPEPEVVGSHTLPAEPRFLLVANHYQRRGLWIAYPASVIASALGRHYALPDPPIRWLVTANWPRWRIGPLSVPSPGDWLLPRVAAAASCYPVPFAGMDPLRAARSLRRLLNDAATSNGPFGLFPEGVAGEAERPAPPLPGAARLIRRIAASGRLTVPVRISEANDRLRVHFLKPVPAQELLTQADPAKYLMSRITSDLTPDEAP